MLGQTIPQFSVPVCTHFRPKLWDGQLCYEINVNSLKNHIGTTVHGAEGGLSFVMDYNWERNVGIGGSEDTLNDNSDNGLAILEAKDNKHKARIFINTLEPYTGEFNTDMNMNIKISFSRIWRRAVCTDICQEDSWH